MGQKNSGCRCSVGTVILSFFVGGLIGTGVALLVAPKTGEETRGMIKDIAEEAKWKIEGYIHDAKGKASAYMERGKGFRIDAIS